MTHATHNTTTDRHHLNAIEAVRVLNDPTDPFAIEWAGFAPGIAPPKFRYRLVHSLLRCARREAMIEADNAMGDPHP